MKKLLTLTLALIAATGWCADKRFDQLNVTNVLFGTDIFPIEAAGSQKNFQVPWSLMANTAGASATNYGNTIGANATNYANTIGLNGSNYSKIIGGYSTNYANTIGANATSYINTASVNLSNYVNTGVWLTNATRGSPNVGTNVAAGQGLVWDDVNHVWTNGTVSAVGAFIDNNNGNGTNLTVYGTLTATNLDLDTLNVGTLYATNAPGILTTNNSSQFIAKTNGYGTNTILNAPVLTNGTFFTFNMAEVTAPAVSPTNTLAVFGIDDNGFTVMETITDLGIRNRINQDCYRICRNNSGAPITAGKVVYFHSSSGQVPNFRMAQANSLSTMPAIGITTATVADNGFGEIMIIGRLTNLKTDYPGWAEGDVLYVSADVAGGLTNVTPLHPNFSQWIATIENVDNNLGTILVKTQAMLGEEDGTVYNSFTIGDQLTGIKSLKMDSTNDAQLNWNSATGLWDFSKGNLGVAGSIYSTNGATLYTLAKETNINIINSPSILTISGTNDGLGNQPIVQLRDFNDVGAYYAIGDSFSNWWTIGALFGGTQPLEIKDSFGLTAVSILPDPFNYFTFRGTIQATNGAFKNDVYVTNNITAKNITIDSNAYVNTLYATNFLGASANFIAKTNGYGTNTILNVPTLTNAINYGNAFSSVGSGANSEQYGVSAVASNAGSIAIGNIALSGGDGSVVIGNFSSTKKINSIAIGSTASGEGEQSISIGDTAQGTGDASIAIGVGAIAYKGNSIAIGNLADAQYTNSVSFLGSATESNQFMFGDSSYTYQFPGTIYAHGAIYSNAVLSTSPSASNAPAHNEFPTAGWVRDLFAGSGTIWYNSTNLGPGFVKGAVPFLFITNIPYQFARSYTTPTNNEYVGAVGLTNQTAFSGPITVSAYLSATGGTGGTRGLSVKPEIYYSYDSGTNLLGNWDAQPQALALDQTNRYDFVVAVPTTITTGGVFTIYRVFKITSATGVTTPTLVIAGGTNTPGQISITGPSSLGGNAFLGVNQTFTGTNTFSQPVLSTSASASNSPAANELPNATWVAGKIGTLTNWNTVPLGQPGEMLMMLNTKPIWIDPSDMINDGMFAVSSTLSAAGGTQSTGGGSTAVFSANPAAGNRANRNFFLNPKIYGTNGLGATHFVRMLYDNGFTVLGIGNNSFSFDLDVLFETAFTNLSFQAGFIQASAVSSQNYAIMFEANSQLSPNWIAKSHNTGTNDWDTGIPIALNAWLSLKFSGTTNSIVFYTNGVAGFTNSTVSSIPTSSLIVAGCNITNSKTNSDAVGSVNSVFLDRVRFLVTTNTIQ